MQGLLRVQPVVHIISLNHYGNQTNSVWLKPFFIRKKSHGEDMTPCYFDFWLVLVFTLPYTKLLRNKSKDFFLLYNPWDPNKNKSYCSRSIRKTQKGSWNFDALWAQVLFRMKTVSQLALKMKGWMTRQWKSQWA